MDIEDIGPLLEAGRADAIARERRGLLDAFGLADTQLETTPDGKHLIRVEGRTYQLGLDDDDEPWVKVKPHPIPPGYDGVWSHYSLFIGRVIDVTERRLRLADQIHKLTRDVRI